MKTERRYDIDWLRTTGVLLVIPFHTLIMFNMNPSSIVYIKDTVNVHFFNIVDSIIDRFHMPLLFVLAGMSAYYALKTRATIKFIKERMRKLLIPAIFGCIILNPVMTYIYMISKHKNIGFIEHLIGFFSKNPGDFTGINGAFTPAHLWFIIFLFVFSLVALPMFLMIDNKKDAKFSINLAAFCEKPLMLLIVTVPISVLSLTNILGDRNPLVYLFMFIMGYVFATNERYQRTLNRDKWTYLLLSIVLMYLKFNISSHNMLWSIQWVAYGLLDKATRVAPVFSLLGLANCYINTNSAVLKYLSQASFTVYVIHMLINTVVGYFILPVNIYVGVKYIVIVFITFVLCFLFYEMIRRINSKTIC